MDFRQHIVEEIKRLAGADGRAPGKQRFAQSTGIKEHQWSGVFWTKWGDALAEAGMSPNRMQGRFDSDQILLTVANACIHFQRFPTSAELKLYLRSKPNFPSKNTIANHFPTRALLVKALSEYVKDSAEFESVAPLLPNAQSNQTDEDVSPEVHPRHGWVYLLKSGTHYKIGQSYEVERRMREISIALPEKVTLIHAIKTDDPIGIEAYWHKRFAPSRANGEWFRLNASDLKAFRSRTRQ